MNATTNKSIEQLAAEAEAAQRALQEAQAAAVRAEQARKEAERIEKARLEAEARRNAPEPAHYTKAREHLQSIADWLVKLCKDSEIVKADKLSVKVSPPKRVELKVDDSTFANPAWEYPRMAITYRNTDVWVNVEFKAEQTGSSWRKHSTGRVRCSVGNYGEQSSFPPKKDGTYSYDKIAEVLFGNVASREREIENALKVRANNEKLQALRKKFNRSEYDPLLSVQSDKYTAPVGQVFINLKTQCSLEAAEQLLDLAAKLGIIK